MKTRSRTLGFFVLSVSLLLGLYLGVLHQSFSPPSGVAVEQVKTEPDLRVSFEVLGITLDGNPVTLHRVHPHPFH